MRHSHSHVWQGTRHTEGHQLVRQGLQVVLRRVQPGHDLRELKLEHIDGVEQLLVAGLPAGGSADPVTSTLPQKPGVCSTLHQPEVL